MGYLSSALFAQLVQVARLALINYIQLSPQHRQHSQQLARAKLRRAAPLKP